MLRCLVAVGICASLGLAQGVYVVGPGGQYADLPAAVQAVPSGSTLHVLPGTYTAPHVVGKALSIVGLGSPAPILVSNTNLSQVGVANTRAGETVLLQNLEFRGVVHRPAVFAVDNAAGRVVVRDCRFEADSWTTALQAMVEVRGSHDVWIHQLAARSFPGQPPSSVTGFVAVDSTLQYEGTASPMLAADAMRLTNCTATLCNPTLRGGDGLTLAKGRSGLVVDGGSWVAMMGGFVRGGNGGPSPGIVTYSVPGGDGVQVLGGSHAAIYGAFILGGDDPRSIQRGESIFVESGATVDERRLQAPPLLRQTGPAVRGGRLQLTPSGELGAAACLVANLSGVAGRRPLAGAAVALVDATPLLGVVLSQPSVTLTGAQVGHVDIPLALPPQWPFGVPLYLQSVAAVPGASRLWTSNVLALLPR